MEDAGAARPADTGDAAARRGQGHGGAKSRDGKPGGVRERGNEVGANGGRKGGSALFDRTPSGYVRDHAAARHFRCGHGDDVREDGGNAGTIATADSAYVRGHSRGKSRGVNSLESGNVVAIVRGDFESLQPHAGPRPATRFHGSVAASGGAFANARRKGSRNRAVPGGFPATVSGGALGGGDCGTLCAVSEIEGRADANGGEEDAPRVLTFGDYRRPAGTVCQDCGGAGYISICGSASHAGIESRRNRPLSQKFGGCGEWKSGVGATVA